MTKSFAGGLAPRVMRPARQQIYPVSRHTRGAGRGGPHELGAPRRFLTRASSSQRPGICGWSTRAAGDGVFSWVASYSGGGSTHRVHSSAPSQTLNV